MKRFSFSIIVYFITFSILGICFIPSLNINLYPSNEVRQIELLFQLQEKDSPIVVERMITSRIEAMLLRIQGIDGISSITESKTAKINMRLSEDADPDVVRFDISTAVRQMWPKLSAGMSYPEIIVNRSSRYSPINTEELCLEYSVHAHDNTDNTTDFIECCIRPIIANVDGVDRVEVSGDQMMEWELSYDVDQLIHLGIAPHEIKMAIDDQYKDSYVGFGKLTSWDDQKQPNAIYLTAFPDHFTEEYARKIPIKKIDGKLIYLTDIVRLRYQKEKAKSFTRINGEPTVTIKIFARSDVNQIRVVEQVKEALNGVNNSAESKFELLLIQDATKQLKEEFINIFYRSGLAILLLLLFVLLVSQSLKYSFVIALSIGMNIALAFLVYHFFDVEINIYSVAAITISLGLVIDNVIVMADHLVHQNKRSIYIAILAATLTTVASLSVIFLLDESVQLMMADFSLVLIINLLISLLITFFLTPALLSQFNLLTDRRIHFKNLRVAIKRERLYNGFLQSILTGRKFIFLIYLLSFGLPFFLLPSHIHVVNPYAQIYSSSMPYIKQWLGGSLYLFVNKEQDFTKFNDSVEDLLIEARLPSGGTLQEMDETMHTMEGFIRQFSGYEKFTTEVQSGSTACLKVEFSPEGRRNGIPEKMKEFLIQQALKIGNVSWSIQGVGDSFENHIVKKPGHNKIKLIGYNYDQLIIHAQNICVALDNFRRVRNVGITSGLPYDFQPEEDFVFRADYAQLVDKNIAVSDLHESLASFLTKNDDFSLYLDQGVETKFGMEPLQSQDYDLWDVHNYLMNMGKSSFRIGQVATLTKQEVPQRIYKKNQQYEIHIRYDYKGSGGQDVLDQVIESYRDKLPMGYTLSTDKPYAYQLGIQSDNSFDQLKAVLFVVLIIYLICCILYNSLIYPLAIISIIPISYIGVFFVFGVTDLPINSGVFAAFILLTGLTCNSAIFVVNEYKNLRSSGFASGTKTYSRALTKKIIPILLTFLSTALGFIPFLLEEQPDLFWLSLSVGLICGLIFSLIGLFIVLPLIIIKKTLYCKKT